MTKIALTRFTLPFLLLICNGAEISLAEKNPQGPSGTLEKMIIANGTVAMNVDSGLLGGSSSQKAESIRFTVAPDSFFRVIVFNNEFRGAEPSSMGLTPQNGATLSGALKAAADQLIIERNDSDASSELVVRNGKTGFVFFNIDGNEYNYDASQHVLNINGRLALGQDFAALLGRSAEIGAAVGNISIVATVYPYEVDKLVNGDLKSAVLPAHAQPDNGTTPGPDVIVGDIISVAQPSGGSNGIEGNYVGLGVGTYSCNAGVVDLDWFQLPNNDHPVIPQNLYRMSGGTTNTDRFEQIGQSWLKHAFEALTDNICNYGCNGVGNTHLGSGCADPYVASLNYSQSGLGSRAWVNPFTGFFPGSNPNPADHSQHTTSAGHPHTGASHRVRVLMDDLRTNLNVGASYFAEAQYVTPHEYAWCQSHPGQCNMYNNVSYRQISVTGTGSSFSFTNVGSTVRQRPAIFGWTGATVNQFEPVPGTDGIGFIAYKVTNPSAGVYHYEYVVFNENLDRAIQSLSVPLGCGITISNLGFHSPTQEPPWPADGTQNNAGLSSTPWTSNQTANALSWNCETFAQNQNANAIRWGTSYNFRFDSNKPPQATQATIGFFKTGTPITVNIQAPAPDPCNPLTITNVVSRKTHGTAGDFDINLPLSGQPGVECRDTNGNHTFVFTFTNNVVSGNASVTTGTGNVSGSPTFSGNTMTVNLTGVTDVQQIAVTASGVMDTFGQTLPDTAVPANMLAGDTTGNKTVNSSDVGMTKQQVGAAVDATNFRTDVNANGTLNASDVSIVKELSGDSLP